MFVLVHVDLVYVIIIIITPCMRSRGRVIGVCVCGHNNELFERTKHFDGLLK